MPRVHIMGMGSSQNTNGGQVPQMPQYQAPQYDPSEADDEAALETMRRSIPSYLLDQSSVRDPFERIAAGVWGMNNSAHLDSYNQLADKVNSRRAGRKIQAEQLQIQGMQQNNQFKFEDQERQKATFARDWNQNTEDRVYTNDARDHARRMFPLQEQGASQGNEINALNIGEKKDDLFEKAMDRKAIMSFLGGGGMNNMASGSFDRLAQMDAEDNVDIQGNSPATQMILGGGVTSPLAPVQQQSRASVMEEGLRSKIAADAASTASILKSGGSVGLFKAMLGDHERRAGAMISAARSTSEGIVNDEFKRRDDNRLDRRFNVDAKLRAANEINTSRRLDMQQQALDLNSRKLDMLATKPQIDALKKQEIDIVSTLRRISTDGTGRYKTDDKTIQKLNDDLKNIRARQRAYEAQNGGEPVNAFVPSIGTDGSVTMTFDGQTARIDAKRRREIEADIKQANPGIRYGSDEFNQMLLDHLQQEAVGANEPKKSSGGWFW